MPSTIEAELRFRAEADAPLELLEHAAILGPATLGAAQTADETDRYLDTPDRRMSAAGWACRLRSRSGRTIVSLKGPPEHAPGSPMHLRPEIEGPGSDSLDPAEWPSSPARDHVLAMARGSVLEVRVTLRQRRTERVVEVEGSRVGLLSLDRVRVMDGDLERGVLRIVELELDPKAFDEGFDPSPMTTALAAVPGLILDAESKYTRSLAMLATGSR